MAAPADSARQPTSVATAAATWNVNVGSPSAGTLLIVFIRSGGASGGATFAGYTALVDNEVSDATDDSTFVYWRWADGNEGVSDVWDPVNVVKGCAICWEVTGAANEAPAISTVNVGTTSANTATGNSVAPTGAPQDTLYITFAAGDGEVGAYTGAPTSYVNLQATNSGTGGQPATNVLMGGASQQINASSSNDPSTFAHAAHVNGWTAYTIAIRPPPPASTSLLLPNSQGRWLPIRV